MLYIYKSYISPDESWEERNTCMWICVYIYILSKVCHPVQTFDSSHLQNFFAEQLILNA